jgi:hypothetical protein
MNDETRTVKLTELKTQIDQSSYAIDVGAVAEAFVARMLAARGAQRRADVRALLGDATLRQITLPA